MSSETYEQAVHLRAVYLGQLAMLEHCVRYLAESTKSSDPQHGHPTPHQLELLDEAYLRAREASQSYTQAVQP